MPEYSRTFARSTDALKNSQNGEKWYNHDHQKSVQKEKRLLVSLHLKGRSSNIQLAIRSFLTIAALFALWSPGEVYGQMPSIRYNRSNNSLEGRLSPGSPFFVRGTIYPDEQVVKVFYIKTISDTCPKLDVKKIQCPLPEKVGSWACQEWVRDRNTEAKSFRVMIPRLRRAFSRYCFQVVYYYQSLSNYQLEGLLGQLSLQIQQQVQTQWEVTDIRAKRINRSTPQRMKRFTLYFRKSKLNPGDKRDLRKVTSQISNQFLTNVLSRYLRKGNTAQLNQLQRFFEEESYNYGLYFLLLRTARQRLESLSQYILFQKTIQSEIGTFMSRLQRNKRPDLQKLLKTIPAGSRHTLQKSLGRFFKQYRQMDENQFYELLEGDKKQTLRTWARELEQMCLGIDNIHRKTIGAIAFAQWRAKMLQDQGSKVQNTRMKNLALDLEQLSCHRSLPTKVIDLISPGKKPKFALSNGGDRILRPNTRMTLFDFIRYLRITANTNVLYKLNTSKLKKERQRLFHALKSKLSTADIKSANVSSSQSLNAQRYFWNFLSTEIGFAGTLLPNKHGSVNFQFFPYFGLHVYFVPIHSSIPLLVEDGFWRRFSVFAGASIGTFELEHPDIHAIGTMGGMAPLLGAGFRLTDFIRFNVGTMLYHIKRLHPFYQDVTERIALTGFVSLSMNINLFQIVGEGFKSASRK